MMLNCSKPISFILLGLFASALLRAQNPSYEQANALNLQGAALTARGDLQAANEAFRSALTVAPHFSAARKNLAVNQLALKQTADAEKNFAVLLKETPGDPSIHMYLAEIRFRAKDYAVAASHLGAVRSYWPGDARLPVMMAECDFHLGNPSEGVHLLQTVDVSKINVIWQFHAGFLLAEHQEFAAATPFFEAARQNYPQPFDVAFDLATCYTQTKKFQQAITVLSELRDKGSETSEIDNLLAEAY